MEITQTFYLCTAYTFRIKGTETHGFGASSNEVDEMNVVDSSKSRTVERAMQPSQDLPTFESHIRTLVTLDETDAPVLSCYLNLETRHEWRPMFDSRVRLLRQTICHGEEEPFERAVARVQGFLESALVPASKGAVVFARSGSQPFFLPLQFQVPLPNHVAVDSTPNIYHLVELKDTYHRYIVMISTEEHARILEVNLGAVTRQLWSERPELHERIGREWTREHYQSHRRSRADRFIKEKVQVLERLMTGGGHTHLILAGNPHLTARVRNALPAHLATKLIDIVPATAQARTSDVVAATLARFVEQEERESIDAVALLVREVRRHGLAVVGTRRSLEALLRSQVDMLLIAGSYEPPPGWRCPGCGHVDARIEAPAHCHICGRSGLQGVDLKETMVRLAERSGCRTELVGHSDVLMALGGVGCLLRYLTPEP